ncbi:MAG: type VI secretion system baseplate subunit TssG [Rubrivivax sp.]|nr:type VI secretion system baseplate subunit TssG [Rubrivivax sp.]
MPELGPALASDMARRLTRRDWRRLRQLLARGDLGSIVDSLRHDQIRRASLLPSAPVKWSRTQALVTLQAQRDRATLFGAVRLLQAAAPDAQPLGYAINPDREAVRLDQGLVQGFIGREVADVSAGHQEVPGDPPKGWTGRPVLTQNALGLLGPNGPMPIAWTQHVRDLPSSGSARPRQSFVSFVNLVQRRQLALLYRAWSDAQPVTALDTPGHRHPVEARLAALAGLGSGDMVRRDAVSPSFKLAFAGVLSRRVRSPGALAAMLERYLSERVVVKEFSCRWLEIPEHQQTRLGKSYSRIGQDGVAGRRTWDCSTRFDIVVGPLDLPTYWALLPGQALHDEVRDLVALYAGPEWAWRLQPLLQRRHVPVNRLGGQVARLGLTTWLGHGPADRDADDLRLSMAPHFSARQAEATAMDESVDA